MISFALTGLIWGCSILCWPPHQVVVSGASLLAFGCFGAPEQRRQSNKILLTEKVFMNAEIRHTSTNGNGDASEYDGRRGQETKWNSLWNEQFELLKQYKNHHGDCLVPKSYTTRDGVHLGKWVDNQRLQYKNFQKGKKSALTQERIEKLESIGFVWEVQSQWNGQFKLLQQYKNDHGDCLVPRRCTTSAGTNLGRWVNTQRQQYKKFEEGKPSHMTQERIDKLESIGFVWDAQESQWNELFELLQLYKNDHGDCLVPHNYTTSAGVNLGLWVTKQRQQYKKSQEGKPSHMVQERIKKLESIGFVWDLQESQWNEQFEVLQQYKKDDGDCHVPQSYTTKDGVNLGRWVHNQRLQYKKFQEGKPSSMTQERIETLERIGFPWSSSQKRV